MRARERGCGFKEVLIAWAMVLAFAGMMIVILGATACSPEQDQPKSDVYVPGNDAGADLTPADDTLAADDTLQSDSVQPTATEVVILHTNDLHDHVMGTGPSADYTPDTAGDDSTRGGYARLAARIAEERKAAAASGAPVLLLDAGDFMMGSLFTWLSLSEAPSLTFMQQAGYDAITLGNHEFDWTPDGLGWTLDAAFKAGFQVPILASNTVFSSTSTEDDNLEQFKTAGLIRTKLVKTLDNGVKVGIFGVMGADSPVADPVTFDDVKSVAKQLVTELRQQDQVDLVICLSHTGIDASGSGPDAELASEVPGIDVIISGHTHVALAQPVLVGQTLIVQAGHNGEHLGRLVLRLQDGQVSLKGYNLLTIDDSKAGDAKIQQTVDGWIQALDALLQPAGLSYAQVVAETDFDLTIPPAQESILGNVVTDSYRTVVDALEPAEQVVLAFEANGLIRDPIYEGKTGQLGFADLYRALSLGAGPDGEPGYPLVTFYLSGAEIKMGLELTANADLVGNDYFLQVSGVQLTYDKAGQPFNRVIGVKKEDGTAIDLASTTTCHKVATNYYLAAALPMLKLLTSGAIDITPRAKDCTPITDITTRIVDRDPATSGLQELKQWQALVQYLSQMPDTDGNQIPDLPSPYAKLQQRIVAK